MNDALKQEYNDFVQKYSEDYKLELSELQKKLVPQGLIDVYSLFTGFVCYKALINPGNFTLGLTPFESMPEPPVDLYKKTFSDTNLNINVTRVLLHIYVDIPSKFIHPYVQREDVDNMEQGYRIDDLILNRNELPPNPNKMHRADDYKKVTGLVDLIGDPTQVILRPHNFSGHNIDFYKGLLWQLFTEDAEVIDYDYKIMLMNNASSDILKMYGWLEQQAQDHNKTPFFSTDSIVWARLPDGFYKRNPHFNLGKSLLFSAEYYANLNSLTIRSKVKPSEQGVLESLRGLGIGLEFALD